MGKDLRSVWCFFASNPLKTTLARRPVLIGQRMLKYDLATTRKTNSLLHFLIVFTQERN